MNKGGRPVIYIPYKADKCLLEDSIKNAYERSNNNSIEMQEIHRSLKWIITHVKRMSNGKSENHKDYEDYYEEMEWRLVYDESPNSIHFTMGDTQGTRRVEFMAKDIKVIIFPDEKTKHMSLNDEAVKRFFSQHMPIMATLDDCCNF